MKHHHSLDVLFAAARQERRCAIPATNTDAKAVARRVREGSVVRVFRGLYAERHYWNMLHNHDKLRHIVRALAKQHPNWVFCGPTAAVMHGLDCSYRFLTPICIAAPPGSHHRSTKQLKRCPMSHPDVTVVDGVRVTSLLRTLFDCASTMSIRYALAPLDSAMRNGKVSANVLLAYPSSVKYSRRRAQAQHVFDMADGRSENGGESEARGTLDMVGRPVHDIQSVFRCLDFPGRTHRVDFLWNRKDGTKIVGEFDGTRKYVDPDMTGRRTIQEVVDEERRRQHCLKRQNADTVRLYYDELDDLDALVCKLDSHGVPHG
ncbi:CTP synthase [Bifidobacterium sp. 82T24]|nr:CTP synthase [Bifidobacterium pluvialisilvae]